MNNDLISRDLAISKYYFKLGREEGYQQAKQDIFQKILGICNKGNARQNHIGKFFAIRRLCQEELKGEGK